MNPDERRKQGLWWDKPWSLVDGCNPVSTGCDGCWARRWIIRFRGVCDVPVEFRSDRLSIPKRKRKRTIWAVWNDLFHERVNDQQIQSAINIIRECQNHVFVILTKRIERLASLEKINFFDWPDNVFVGTSVENQETADQRIPFLKSVTAKKILSVEPLIGSVKIEYEKIDWVVAGGETGPGARRCNPQWIVDIQRWCEKNNICFWFKSYGTNMKYNVLNKYLYLENCREYPKGIR